MTNQQQAYIGDDILNIDFGKVNEFTTNLPAGTYEVDIHSVKVDTDNKGENGAQRTFVVFTFKVAEGDYKGMTQVEKIMVPSFYSKLKTILGHLGYDTTGSLNVRQLIASDALLGKPLKIVVTTSPGKKEGQTFTNVSGYERSTRSAAGAGPLGGISSGAPLPGLPTV